LVVVNWCYVCVVFVFGGGGGGVRSWYLQSKIDNTQLIFQINFLS